MLLHPLAWLWLGLCLPALVPPSHGQAVTPAPQEPTAVKVVAVNDTPITNAQEFWGLSNEQKMQMHHIRFDMLVYYYDPHWQLIWGDCDGRGSFLPLRGEALPIQPGQRVRIEGIVQPSRGILRDEVTVTILQDHAMPEPKVLAGRLTASDQFDAQWTRLEGYVCQQSVVDNTHLLFQVLSEGRLVHARVLVPASAPVPQLVNHRVRIDGVYVANFDAENNLHTINLWVPRLTDVEHLGSPEEDERFRLPPTPINQLTAQEPASWVRVQGKVHAITPGQGLTLRDETGQMVISTPQPTTLQVGDNLEVIGRAAGAGLTPTLAEAYIRPLAIRGDDQAAALHRGEPGQNLRLIAQILDLPVGEIIRHYPVTLKGVVTWAHPLVDHFYLQDSSGAIGIRRVAGLRAPVIGEALQVHGVTMLGSYAPEVRAQELLPSGHLEIPVPRQITLQQALTGAEEARWVELRGYLRQAEPSGQWTRLDLTTASGEFSAYAPRNDALGGLTGAMVQISGVCAAEANSRRQLTGLRLWVPGPAAIKVLEPAPTDPFSAPRHTLTGLKQFTGATAFNHRVTIVGVVIARVAGRYLLLQEGESGLLVYTRERGLHPIGSTVEAAGLPGFDGSRLVLREAQVRPAQSALLAAPRPLEQPAEILADADACLVSLEARLHQVSWQNDRWRLTLQAGGTTFDAHLETGPEWDPPQPATELALTGVYLLEFDESHHPRGFLLQLREPGDLKILRLPSWWTTGRALTMAGGLALCTALGSFWVALLRRRVKEQTEQIRQQLEKEARLQTELERSSRLESLGVLAGGIAHDFNNLLTAILGNLGLALLDQRATAAVGDCLAEAERGARRARDITQQLLTFAKGGDPIRNAVALPEIITEAANFARHGSNVRFEFDFPPSLPPGDVDAGQISRVIHNLVLNAVQAMPEGGIVRLALLATELRPAERENLPPGPYLQLTVTDTGKGIPADVLPRIFDPYFSTKAKAGNSGLGLATVRSIIRKHNGHIEVESVVGRGTQFRIWLPAAPAMPAPEATAAPRPGIPRPARILVMDDEEVIRRVAARMLSLAGHDTVFASDGTEAVRAYTTAHQSNRPFDLVIFDLTVPGGMGGKDALQVLLKLDPAIRAVASSGYSSDPVMANPRSYGFITCLPKPYDIPDLLRVVEETRR